MTTVRWEAITSGETFQAFAAQLLLHVDPNNQVFTWPGPDGGQDARSRDGTIAYQAKHHSRPEAKHPREDAMKELAKIHEYQRPTHARQTQWAAVTRWVLLTNVATQVTERARWEAEVVPAFRAAGLEAELWGAERLEKHVADFPALGRAFFEGETRAFMSLGEAMRQAVGLDPATHAGVLPTLRGRDPLVSAVVSHLAGHRIVPLVAPAGVGSTRVALAAAATAVASGVVPAAYFASAANLASDMQWYSAFVPEHPMVVVLDELDDDDGVRIVKRIIEQMDGRTATWKIVVVIEPHQDAIRAALLRARGVAPEVEIGPLSRDDAAALVDEIVRRRLTAGSIVESEFERLARAIATHAGGFPLWATVSALTLAAGKALTTVAASRREHVREFLRALPMQVSQHAQEQRMVVPTIRAVAALGTLDLHESASRSWVRELAGGITDDELHEVLRGLERLRVMRRRGADRRLWSVTPGVLSDAIVAEWLTEPSGGVEIAAGAATLAARLRDAVRAGDVSRPAIAVLRTLARVGYVGGDEARGVREAVRDALSEMRTRAGGPDDIVRAIDVAEEIAHWMPQVAVDLALDVLTRCAEVDAAMRPARKRIPWLLFHAAGGARTADERREVVNALFRAAEREAGERPRGRDDDGKSAPRMIARILESIDEVSGDFSTEYEAVVAKQLKGRVTDATSLQATEWLITPLVHTEGMTTRYEFDSYQYRHYRIHPESARARARWRLIDRLWRLLEQDFKSAWRAVAWRALHASRSGIMFGSDDARDRARPHFERALAILGGHPALGLDEVRAAREGWEWYLDFGEAGEEKELAQQCEAHYKRVIQEDAATNILLGQSFDAELEPARTGSADDIAVQFAGLLAAARRIDGDNAWLRARRFAEIVGASGRSECREAFFLIAPHAAEGAREASVIVDYLGELLHAARTQGGARIADLWRDVDAHAPSIAGAARASLYGSRGTVPGALRSEDFAAFSAAIEGLAGTSPIETFNALGRMLWLGDAVRLAVARAWPATSAARRAQAFVVLVEGAQGALSAQLLPPVQTFSEWLLDQLVEVPCPDHVFGETGNWYLDQVLGTCGRPGVAWLAKFLRERAARHARLGCEYDAVPHSTPLHRFVVLDDPDAAVLEEVFRLVEDEPERPEWLTRLDRAGTVLLPLMEAAIDAASADRRRLARAAEWAACYPESGTEWRRLAARAVAAAAAYPTDQRHPVYHRLTDHGGVHFGTVGEVAPRWVEDLATAEKRLAEEGDAALRDYWRWRVAGAKADLERERQRVEERG